MAQTKSSSPKITKILGKWRSSSCAYYLVKWQDGYPDTWERLEDVKEQKDVLETFRSWVDQRELNKICNNRGSFLPEARDTSVKHGLTSAMLKYVVNQKVNNNKNAHNDSECNTNNNANRDSKSSQKVSEKKQVKPNSKDPTRTVTQSKSAKTRKKDASVKVVSKPRNVRNATNKVSAARSKAVKVLTKAKRSPNSIKSPGKTKASSAKQSSQKSKLAKKQSASKNKSKSSQAKSSKSGKAKTESNDETRNCEKEGNISNISTTNLSPSRISSRTTKGVSSKTKERSPAKPPQSTVLAKPKPSSSVELNKSVQKKNISQGKVKDNAKQTKPSNKSTEVVQTKAQPQNNSRGTKTQTPPKKPDLKTSNGKVNDSNTSTNVNANKSRKRTAENSISPARSNQSQKSPNRIEPKAKRQLLDKAANTSPVKTKHVQLSETDTDTDSETLYSLSADALTETLKKSKKLRLNIMDIRSSTASSECTTPDSDYENLLQSLTKSPSKYIARERSATCRVCGDKAISGLAYGGQVCGSCRSFYKRAALLKRTAIRPCDQQCAITIDTRRDCMSCRLRKCNAIGMSPAYANNAMRYSPQKPTLLPVTPPSLGTSPYKTPPRTQEGAQDTPPDSDVLDSIPDIPIMPMLPNSPAASHRNLMKRMKSLEADRAIKREGTEIERRTSVRQSESVFKYKDIVVRKNQGFTQILLFTTSTTMKNALNPDVFNELKSALENARKDDSKLVMLSAQGSVFCSGVDLGHIISGQHEKMVTAVRDFVSVMISYPKPVVAVVNGPAVGLGVALLPLCDIVYASDKASFYCPYSRLCQTPEACASYTFPHVLGNAMANEMLLAGRKLTALEAHQAGLVSHVFWPTSLMQEVVPRLQQMAQSSAKALEASKLLIRSHTKAKLEFTNETECQILEERWKSSHTIKAMQAFIQEEQDFIIF